jgi:hypothetical protein
LLDRAHHETRFTIVDADEALINVRSRHERPIPFVLNFEQHGTDWRAHANHLQRQAQSYGDRAYDAALDIQLLRRFSNDRLGYAMINKYSPPTPASTPRIGGEGRRPHAPDPVVLSTLIAASVAAAGTLLAIVNF